MESMKKNASLVRMLELPKSSTTKQKKKRKKKMKKKSSDVEYEKANMPETVTGAM